MTKPEVQNKVELAEVPGPFSLRAEDAAAARGRMAPASKKLKLRKRTLMWIGEPGRR